MMPPLLPSEIARIVYGQLIRCDCSTVAERFLNESPHLEECREFVDRMGKPTFIAKAYGLSLQQILERYLEMWHLILERTNDTTPDTREKFADPVDALKFLLTAYDQTASQDGDVRSFSDEVKENSIHDDGGGAPSSSSSHTSLTATTEDADLAFQSESIHRPERNRVRDVVDVSESTGARVAIGQHVTTRRDCSSSPPKLKKPNSYLHELYASTEIAENNGVGSKKKLKVLKPRQPAFNKSSAGAITTATATATCSSAPRKAASNPNLSEDKFRFEDNSSYNGEACVHSEENFATTVSPTDKSSSASEHTKKTNMQLRSSSKVPDRVAQRANAASKNDVKVSKKRKYASSPERESALTKQPKLSRSAYEKENDTRVDYTKLSQLLIEDPKLPELIAENINQKILESPEKKTDTSTENLDEMFESIAEKTLGDDLMDEFIQELLHSQNLGQGKHSALIDVSLLDDDPYEANINCVDNTGGDGVSENVDVVDEQPLAQCVEKSEQTLAASTDYSRLHQDMNEFVRFDKPKGDQVVSGDDHQSDIIVLKDSSDFVAAHSNFVVCSSMGESLAMATNEKGLEGDIMAAYNCVESNAVNWNVPTTSSMVVAAAAAPTKANTKLKIRGPVASPTKLSKRNYRPIAPKPNSAAVSKPSSSDAVIPLEPNSHSNKSKSSKRTKK